MLISLRLLVLKIIQQGLLLCGVRPSTSFGLGTTTTLMVLSTLLAPAATTGPLLPLILPAPTAYSSTAPVSTPRATTTVASACRSVVLLASR